MDKQETIEKVKRVADAGYKRHMSYCESAEALAIRIVEELFDEFPEMFPLVEPVGERIIFHTGDRKLVFALSKAFHLKFKKSFAEYDGTMTYDAHIGTTTLLVFNVKDFPKCTLVPHESIEKVIRYELKCT